AAGHRTRRDMDRRRPHRPPGHPAAHSGRRRADDGRLPGWLLRPERTAPGGPERQWQPHRAASCPAPTDGAAPRPRARGRDAERGGQDRERPGHARRRRRGGWRWAVVPSAGRCVAGGIMTGQPVPACGRSPLGPRLSAMRLRRRATLLAAVLVAVAGRSWAQNATPIFHGVLGIRPAVGTIEKNVGIANIKIKGWDLWLQPQSNGISPTTEQIIIAIGDSERLVVQAGSVKGSRNGKRFTFNDPKTPRGVRSLKIVQYTKGCPALACYKVSFALVKIDLSALVLE